MIRNKKANRRPERSRRLVLSCSFPADTREDYDRWRYNYPKYDTIQRWAKVPSKELSDFLIEALKDKLDKDE